MTAPLHRPVPHPPRSPATAPPSLSRTRTRTSSTPSSPRGGRATPRMARKPSIRPTASTREDSTMSYESCVLDAEGNCSRWNHDHPPVTTKDSTTETINGYTVVASHPRGLDAERVILAVLRRGGGVEYVTAIAKLGPVQEWYWGHYFGGS